MQTNLLSQLLIKVKPIIMIQYLFAISFADVAIKDPLMYINSLVNVGIALNQASFADTYKIGTGNDWKIDLTRE